MKIKLIFKSLTIAIKFKVLSNCSSWFAPEKINTYPYIPGLSTGGMRLDEFEV